MLLADLPPDLPLLLFATADVPGQELDPEARALFGGAQVRAPVAWCWGFEGRVGEWGGCIEGAGMEARGGGGMGAD